jgi:arylsulfatase
LKPLGYRTYHSGKVAHALFRPAREGSRSITLTRCSTSSAFSPRIATNSTGSLFPKPGEGYYSTTAISDYAVRFLKEHSQEHAAEPFFLFLAPHAPHFPLQAPREDIEKYKDRFAEGWDVARERKHARMRRMGLVNCPLAPLEPDMWTKWNTPDGELIAKAGPGEIARALPWNSLNAEQKAFQRMKMAIHAAMISRMDLEIGKVLSQVSAMGAEARHRGAVSFRQRGKFGAVDRGDGHDKTAPPGSARTHLGLGPGWASCSNAPFRLHKSWVNEGGIASPLIVHWPDGIKDAGRLRHDPCHFVDVLPTVVDLAGGSTA